MAVGSSAPELCTAIIGQYIWIFLVIILNIVSMYVNITSVFSWTSQIKINTKHERKHSVQNKDALK